MGNWLHFATSPLGNFIHWTFKFKIFSYYFICRIYSPTLLICRLLSIHFLCGVCRILVFDATVGDRFISSPRESQTAGYRLGANHNGSCHQQVKLNFASLSTSITTTVRPPPLCISSLGGLILDKTITDPNLAGIVVYTPVINGGSDTAF